MSVPTSCTITWMFYLPGLPSHFSSFEMHLSNPVSYEYLPMPYRNFLQDVNESSKEAFLTSHDSPPSFALSHCVDTHSSAWPHFLSRTSSDYHCLKPLSEVQPGAVSSVPGWWLRLVACPLTCTIPLCAKGSIMNLPPHKIKLWVPRGKCCKSLPMSQQSRWLIFVCLFVGNELLSILPSLALISWTQVILPQLPSHAWDYRHETPHLQRGIFNTLI